MSNPRWHTWAAVEARFNWLKGVVELKVVSTHKTHAAAERAAKHIPHSLVRRSATLYNTKKGEWLPPPKKGKHQCLGP